MLRGATDRLAPSARGPHAGAIDDVDLAIRRHVYATFVRDARAPTAAETADAVGAGAAEVEAAYRRLHDAHALVLHAGTTDLRMLNPFSTVETPHRVECRGRSWYANCAWDALGIPAALQEDGSVRSECADCGEELELAVEGGRLSSGGDLLAHILVPARSWWDDIGFT